RPDQHHQPGDGGDGEHYCRPARQGYGATHRGTSDTRSQPAPRILVTCGANAGAPASPPRVGPADTTSPSASTTTSSAASAANSTSWVATSTARPSSASRRSTSASSSLAG